MGSIWLGSMPQVIQGAGLNVRTWPGWETRSRSSGGFDAVWAIGLHHDAITAGRTTDTRCRAAWEVAQYRPVGNIVLVRDGEVVVGAAGATNTQGMGGPYVCSKGTIPTDAGNRYVLAIEAANDGVGEVWPLAQQAAYIKLVRALCDWLGLDTQRDAIAHFEWTDPGESILSGMKRKIDPAGPSQWAVQNAVYPGMWNMPQFRDAVTAYTPPTPGDDVLKTGKQSRIDSRTAPFHKTLEAGEVREVWLDLPDGAKFVQINCVIVPEDKTTRGVVQVGSNPPTEAAPNSTVNWSAGDDRAQSSFFVWVKDGKTIFLKSNRRAEFVIDFTGIWQ